MSLMDATQDKQLLMVFSKSPVAGKVKTRLIPVLGEQGALNLYQTMLRAVLEVCKGSPYTTELWVQGDLQNQFIVQMQQDFFLQVRQQQGSDLGQTLSYAFSESFKNFDKVIVIGGDCVSLDQDYLSKAFQTLSVHDLVIGPAKDGGYVLLGLKVSELVNTVYSRLFQGIAWGTGKVCQQTLTLADALSLSCEVLETRWDVDSQVDLERLAADSRFQYLLVK